MYIDLIIKIKNAQAVGKKTLKTRFSRIDKAVADVLSRNGFVGEVEVKGRPSKRSMFIELQAKRPIEGCVFVSKPSVREHVGYKAIRLVKGGHGVLVLSTPKGVMEGRSARREKVGGQVLCKVW